MNFNGSWLCYRLAIVRGIVMEFNSHPFNFQECGEDIKATHEKTRQVLMMKKNNFINGCFSYVHNTGEQIAISLWLTKEDSSGWQRVKELAISAAQANVEAAKLGLLAAQNFDQEPMIGEKN